MDQQHTFKLIEGEFDAGSAWNILFTLVNSKINFHAMESFGISIRTGGDTSFHDKRIRELTQTTVDIKKALDYAEANNLRLKISSLISVQFVDA